ncbi:MAG TPA: nitroreductase family deazaflavin-dependent oxidoreductase, partial [Candidatus Bathyarchaeia archaeon]|nr:nitroreductase family deazaflavin-dependent oxidoreductase [Candidatus Bathyarchaeia archaeon]
MTIQVQELETPSSEYVRLETIGRKSLQPHQVLVRFITMAETIIVFPQNTGRQDWVSNLKTRPEVKAYAGKSVFSATARVRNITGTSDPILSIFTRKYGMHTVRQRYWGQRTYVELTIRS